MQAAQRRAVGAEDLQSIAGRAVLWHGGESIAAAITASLSSRGTCTSNKHSACNYTIIAVELVLIRRCYEKKRSAETDPR
jgi:hypothetical protein